jgi:hypothetical protein
MEAAFGAFAPGEASPFLKHPEHLSFASFC